jgi:hypothetical protein
MDDKKKDKLDEEVLSRRSFLTGLGKWSAVVVAAAAVGFSEAVGSDAPKEELRDGDELRPEHDGSTRPNDPDIEEQWWRCRVWGNGHRRHGCRVWGNKVGCRVWGNASGCRVWGNKN